MVLSDAADAEERSASAMARASTSDRAVPAFSAARQQNLNSSVGSSRASTCTWWPCLVVQCSAFGESAAPLAQSAQLRSGRPLLASSSLQAAEYAVVLRVWSSWRHQKLSWRSAPRAGRRQKAIVTVSLLIINSRFAKVIAPRRGRSVMQRVGSTFGFVGYETLSRHFPC